MHKHLSIRDEIRGWSHYRWVMDPMGTTNPCIYNTRGTKNIQHHVSVVVLDRSYNRWVFLHNLLVACFAVMELRNFEYKSLYWWCKLTITVVRKNSDRDLLHALDSKMSRNCLKMKKKSFTIGTHVSDLWENEMNSRNHNYQGIPSLKRRTRLYLWLTWMRLTLPDYRYRWGQWII